MRDAKRALGAKTAHVPRLKGATARRVRRLAARRSRGAVALFKRVFFCVRVPKRRRRMGLCLFRISCGNMGAKAFLPSVVRRAYFFAPAERGAGVNPIPQNPRNLCSFLRSRNRALTARFVFVRSRRVKTLRWTIPPRRGETNVTSCATRSARLGQKPHMCRA